MAKAVIGKKGIAEMKKSIITLAILTAAGLAGAETLDRPSGFKIGSRMTLRPYVGFSYTYDSNVDSAKKAESGSSWVIDPGFSFDYIDETWQLKGAAYYQYHSYAEYSRRRNESSYGEKLSFAWSNATNGGPGWTLVLTEDYRKINQDDDMSNDGGRGIGRDRDQFQFNGKLGHRFTENWHAAVNANYYYLDYENSSSHYAPLYGWTRWMVGAEAGYTASKWTDIIIAGNYQRYTQENDKDMGGETGSVRYRNHSSGSEGWTIQGGVATHATERLSYRVLVGWSAFQYGAGSSKDSAFSYTASLNWKMDETWSMMLLAARYFQPAEREYSASVLADAVSWGLAHTMIRGKLNATLDLAYRHEQHSCSGYSSSDYDEDILTARFGLNYTINRYISVFGRVEYQTMFVNRGGTTSVNEYDYDRWRGTLGFRLTY